MNAVRLIQALQEIAEESTRGDSILQPGAAYALGCLAAAVDAGPGTTVEDMADAILAPVGKDQP